MKIAVAYENGNVFDHFGRTQQFKVYEVEGKNVIRNEVADAGTNGHSALVDVLIGLDADALICGGIGSGAKVMLEQSNIALYGGVSGSADKAVDDFINHKLNYAIDVHCDHHEEHEGTCGEHDDKCGH